MEARVKATGEIGIVANIDLLFGSKGYRYQSDEVEIINSYADVDAAKDPDYWTRLEHQYAGMVMGGMCGNMKYNGYAWEDMADFAIKAVHALVEKLKEDKQ